MKKLLCAVALGACAMSAQAATQTFDWSIKGFYNLTGDAFEPNKSASGRFVVDDVNADGRFAASELRAFLFDGTDFMTCTSGPGRRCDLSRFSYTPGTQPIFAIRDASYGEEHLQSYGLVSFNGGATIVESMRMQEWWNEDRYESTDQTKFSISEVSAVPEPQTYLMFGVGLLALAGITRRRAAR